MKFRCPSCDERSITALAKWQSGTANPVVCESCRKGSCEGGLVLGASGALQTVVVFNGVIWAFEFWTWEPLAIGVFLLAGVDAALLRWAPLRVMSTTADREGQLAFAVVFLVLVGSIVAIVSGIGLPARA